MRNRLQMVFLTGDWRMTGNDLNGVSVKYDFDDAMKKGKTGNAAETIRCVSHHTRLPTGRNIWTPARANTSHLSVRTAHVTEPESSR